MAGEHPSPVSIRERVTLEREKMKQKATPLPEHIARPTVRTFIDHMQQESEKQGAPLPRPVNVLLNSIKKVAGDEQVRPLSSIQGKTNNRNLELKGGFADPIEEGEFTPIPDGNPDMYLYEDPPVVDGEVREDLVLEYPSNSDRYDFTPIELHDQDLRTQVEELESYDKEKRRQAKYLHELQPVGDEAAQFKLVHDKVEDRENLERVNAIVAKEKQRRVASVKKDLQKQEKEQWKKIQDAAAYGHRGMRVPQDTAEIARRKGRPTVSTSDAYARRFEQLARSKGYVAPQDLEIPEEERPPQNPTTTEPQEHGGLLNRILRRRQNQQAPQPYTVPAIPTPLLAAEPQIVPYSPDYLAQQPSHNTTSADKDSITVAAPDIGMTPAPTDTLIAMSKRAADRVKVIKEKLTPKEKLLKEPTQVDVHFDDVSEGRGLQEIIENTAHNPDTLETRLREAIQKDSASLSADEIITQLGLTDIVASAEIDLSDAAKVAHLFDVYHFKRTVDSLYPKTQEIAEQELEKKYRQSIEAYRKLGSIISDEDIMPQFHQQFEDALKASRIKDTLHKATPIGKHLITQPIRIKVAQHLYEQLNTRTPPILPVGTTPEALLAAISIGETYQKAADQIYAEAKEEFDILQLAKMPPPPVFRPDSWEPPGGRGTPPPGDPADSTEHGKTPFDREKASYDQLRSLRDTYYHAILGDEADKDKKKSAYVQKQISIIEQWRTEKKQLFADTFTKYATVSDATAKNALATVTELRNSAHIVNSPHTYLKRMVDAIHTMSQDPDLIQNSEGEQGAFALYQEAVLLTQRVSGGIVFDESRLHPDLDASVFAQDFNPIILTDMDGHDIDTEDLDNFVPVIIEEIGIYPSIFDEEKIKREFDARGARVRCRRKSDASAPSPTILSVPPTDGPKLTEEEPDTTATLVGDLTQTRRVHEDITGGDQSRNAALEGNVIRGESTDGLQPEKQNQQETATSDIEIWRRAVERFESARNKYYAGCINKISDENHETLNNNFKNAQKEVWQAWKHTRQDLFEVLRDQYHETKLNDEEYRFVYNHIEPAFSMNDEQAGFTAVARNYLDGLILLEHLYKDSDPTKIVKIRELYNESKQEIEHYTDGWVADESNLLNQTVAQVRTQMGEVRILNEEDMTVWDESLLIISQVSVLGIYPSEYLRRDNIRLTDIFETQTAAVYVRVNQNQGDLKLVKEAAPHFELIPNGAEHKLVETEEVSGSNNKLTLELDEDQYYQYDNRTRNEVHPYAPFGNGPSKDKRRRRIMENRKEKIEDDVEDENEPDIDSLLQRNPKKNKRK